MKLSNSTSKMVPFIILSVLMALTRVDHYGGPVTLPDASLAVFYLAGIFAGGVYSFILFCVEAALIDYLAITQFQVSDYCISPAYVFLIPTYAAMLIAGRLSAKHSTLNMHDLSMNVLYLIGATSIAFVISNTSFYLFSGKFAELSFAQYAERVMLYFPPYLSSTMLYSLLGIIAYRMLQGIYHKTYQLN